MARLRLYPTNLRRAVVFLLNHADKAITVTLPDSYFDILTGEPVSRSLPLGSREVKIL